MSVYLGLSPRLGDGRVSLPPSYRYAEPLNSNSSSAATIRMSSIENRSMITPPTLASRRFPRRNVPKIRFRTTPLETMPASATTTVLPSPRRRRRFDPRRSTSDARLRPAELDPPVVTVSITDRGIAINQNGERRRKRIRQQPLDHVVFERQKTIDNSELKGSKAVTATTATMAASSSYTIQTGIAPNVSGLTATSPRMMRNAIKGDAAATASPPPPPTRTVSALVAPEKSRHVGFHTSESAASETRTSSPDKVGANTKQWWDDWNRYAAPLTRRQRI